MEKKIWLASFIILALALAPQAFAATPNTPIVTELGNFTGFNLGSAHPSCDIWNDAMFCVPNEFNGSGNNILKYNITTGTITTVATHSSTVGRDLTVYGDYGYFNAVAPGTIQTFGRINLNNYSVETLSNPGFVGSQVKCDLRPTTDEIYCVFGSSNNVLSVYNVSSQTWTANVTSMPVSSTGSCAFRDSDELWCYAGDLALKSIWKYSVSGNNVTNVTDNWIGAGSAEGDCAFYNDYFYCYQGDDYNNYPQNDIRWYDPADDTEGIFQGLYTENLTAAECALDENTGIAYCLGGWEGASWGYSSRTYSIELNPQPPETCYGGMSGAGTSGDPCIITNSSQFNAMRDNLTAYYELGNDIDMAGATWDGPVGNWDDAAFTGAFDGKGYNVDNFHWTYTDLTYGNPTAIFGVVEIGGKWLRNVNFDNYSLINTQGSSETCCGGGFVGGDDSSSEWDMSNVHFSNAVVDLRNQQAVGGLVGYFWESMTISNNSFSGEMRGAADTGGLYGWIGKDSVVEYNFFEGNIYLNGSTGAISRVGGIAGQTQQGGIGAMIFNNSYVDANIVNVTPCATSCEFGGFLGGTFPVASARNFTVENSYFNGTLPTNNGGSVLSGYVMGYMAGSNVCSVSNSYYNSDEGNIVNTTICSPDMSGLTTDQFDDESSLTGFDFGTVWAVDYLSTPKFLWQPFTEVPSGPNYANITGCIDLANNTIYTIQNNLSLDASTGSTSGSTYSCILGNNVENVTIDGQGYTLTETGGSQGYTLFALFNAKNITIENINTGSEWFSFISSEYGLSGPVDDVTIRNNTGTGIQFGRGVTNAVIEDNNMTWAATATYDYYPILRLDGATAGDLVENITVTGNYFANEYATQGGPVLELYSNDLGGRDFAYNFLFDNNTFRQVDGPGAIQTSGSSGNGLVNITFTNNTVYQDAVSSSPWGRYIYNNTILHNTWQLVNGSGFSETCTNDGSGYCTEEYADALGPSYFESFWGWSDVNDTQPVALSALQTVVHFDAFGEGNKITDFCVYESSVPGTQWCTTNGSVTSDAVSYGRYNFTMNQSGSTFEITDVPVGETEFVPGDEEYIGKVYEEFLSFVNTNTFNGERAGMGGFHNLTYPYQMYIKNYTTPLVYGGLGMNYPTTANYQSGKVFSYYGGPAGLTYVFENASISHISAGLGGDGPIHFDGVFLATYWNDTYFTAVLDGVQTASYTGLITQEEPERQLWRGAYDGSNSLIERFAMQDATESAVTFEGNDPFAISSCTEITVSGDYYVTQDINSTAGDCIVVSADNVNIDLAGYTVWTLSGDSAYAIQGGIPIYGTQYPPTAFVVNEVENVSVYDGVLRAGAVDGTGTVRGIPLFGKTGGNNNLHVDNVTLRTPIVTGGFTSLLNLVDAIWLQGTTDGFILENSNIVGTARPDQDTKRAELTLSTLTNSIIRNNVFAELNYGVVGDYDTNVTFENNSVTSCSSTDVFVAPRGDTSGLTIKDSTLPTGCAVVGDYWTTAYTYTNMLIENTEYTSVPSGTSIEWDTGTTYPGLMLYNNEFAAITINDATNMDVTGNTFYSTVTAGATASGDVYDNVFNTSATHTFAATVNLNTTVGNTWTNPTNTGYSDTCLTQDGVECALPYVVGSSTDYHPVAFLSAGAIVDCVQINVEGTWELLQNISGDSGQACIYFTASNSIFNFNGYKITGINDEAMYIVGSNSVVNGPGILTTNSGSSGLKIETNDNVTFNDLNVSSGSGEAAVNNVNPPNKITNMVFNNVHFNSPGNAFRLRNAENITFNGGSFSPGQNNDYGLHLWTQAGTSGARIDNVVVNDAQFISKGANNNVNMIYADNGANYEFNNVSFDAQTDRPALLFNIDNVDFYNSYIDGVRGMYLSGTDINVYNNYILSDIVLMSGSRNVTLYNNVINSTGFVENDTTIFYDNGSIGNTWTNPTNTGYSDTCATVDGIVCYEPYVVGSSTDNYPFTLNAVLSSLLTFTAFDDYNAVAINSFCAYDITNASEQWCTTNGTTSEEIFTNGNYTFKINATGYYETQQSEEVTISGNINMTTKGLVTVSNVLVGGSASPSAVWNETTSQVNVSWTHNGVDTATEVDYGVGSAVVYNVSSVLINTNNLAVGENTFTVTTNESYSGLQSQDSDASNAMNVSKLSLPSNVAPNSGQVTQTLFNATWNAATNGLGTTEYDSIIQLNGVNYTLEENSTALFSTVNTTLEGPSYIFVRAKDDYFTTSYVQGGQFEIIFEIGLSSFACPGVLPNEENLPQAAHFEVDFDADLAVGFTTTTLDMTVEQGAESVVIDETDCSYVQNSATSRTYTCNVSMNYWFNPGAYDVNVTVYDASDETNQVEASLCTYGTLVASKRTVDTITFPGAAPGTSDVQGTPAMNMQNTGNVDLDLSMTAQDLTGRTNPAGTLLATNFEAGATLGTATQMQDNVNKDLNMTLLRGAGSNKNVWLWLSMPSNQDPQEYFTPDAWEIFATG